MNTDRSNPTRWLRRLVVAAIATTALAAAPAWANVITWDYTVNTSFASPATGTSGNITAITSNGAANTLLCWGNPGGTPNTTAPCPNAGSITGSLRSALQIDPSTETGSFNTVIGTTIVAGDIGIATKLTHFNNPVSGNSLTSATLKNTITLQAANPLGSALPAWTKDFTINFTETPNEGSASACPAPSTKACSDIFVLGGDALNESFLYGGDTYFLHFFAVDKNGNALAALPSTACKAALVANGCHGFYTQEGQANPMWLGIAISTTPFGVPEPGALGIMGLGVLGIGLAFTLNRRRRDLREE